MDYIPHAAYVYEVPYLAQELAIAKEMALEAGKIHLQYWKKPLNIEMKPGVHGETPVTVADYAANAHICATIVQNFSAHGILTEEQIKEKEIQPALKNWQTAEYTWIIDPLDGTKCFCLPESHPCSTHFGVHIGLCHEGKPVLGVNYFPAIETLYWAVRGQGAFKQVGDAAPQRIFVREGNDLLPLRGMTRTSLSDAFYALINCPLETIPQVGSVGLRFGMIAEGKASLGMLACLGSLWDVCSSDIIVQEAGGVAFTTLDGKPIDYRNSETGLVEGVLCCANAEVHKTALAAAAAAKTAIAKT